MKVWIEERGDFFWLPLYRSQLIYWLTCQYPQDGAKFRKMRNDRLRAIIINTVKRQSKKEFMVEEET